MYRRNYLFYLILAGATAIGYFTTFQVPFQFDDLPNLDNIKFLDQSDDPLHLLAKYPSRVLMHLTLWVDYKLFGDDPTFYHLYNYLQHIVNSLLCLFCLLSLLKATTSSANTEKSRTIEMAAFAGALIFALHPIQTQAVTYITNRATVMVVFFYLGTLALYLTYRKRPERKLFYWLSIGTAVLASLSKQNGFTLPIIIFLVDYLLEPHGQLLKKRFKRLFPYLLVLGIVPTMSFLIGDPSVQKANLQAMWSPWEYFLTETFIILKYWTLLVYPPGQHFNHVMRPFDSVFAPQVLLGLAVNTIVFGIGCWQLGKRRLAGFGILFFYVTMAVESSFFPLEIMMAEHRLYLPLFGICLLISGGTLQIFTRFYQERIVRLSLALIACVLLAFTYNRNQVWKSKVSLWQESAVKSVPNGRTLINLALAIIEEQGDPQLLINTIRDLEEIEFPMKDITYAAFAPYLYDTGWLREATYLFGKAVELDSSNPMYMCKLGAAQVAAHDWRGFRDTISKLNRIFPENLEAVTCVLEIRSMAGNRVDFNFETVSVDSFNLDDETAMAFWYAITLFQNNEIDELGALLSGPLAGVSNHFGLQVLKHRYAILQGRIEPAKAELKKMMAIRPPTLKAAVTLSDALRDNGMGSEAELVLRAYSQVKPQSASVLGALGELLHQRSKGEEAREQLKQAISRCPEALDCASVGHWHYLLFGGKRDESNLQHLKKSLQHGFAPAGIYVQSGAGQP